jgi:uncharacterized membrane protein YbhN (UPF0104 family)
MKRSILIVLQYFFFIALGLLFVWLTIKDIKQEDWAHIKSSLANARSWVILPVLAMLLLSHYSRAIRWKILMEPLGFKPSTFNTLAAVMIGYLVNAGVPRLGEVVKCSILAKYENVRVDRLVGTIVIERIVDLICLIIVFIAALFFQGHIIGDYIAESFGNIFRDESGHTSYRRIVFAFSIITACLFAIYFLLKRFGHIDIVSKIRNVLLGIGHGLNSIRLIKHKGAFIFHTILIWSLYLLSTTVGLYALKETSHLGLAGGLTTLAVGSIGMIITPGGIGAYPLLVAKLMELYGLDPHTIGTALGWLLWTAQTVIIVVCGVIFSGLFSYHNKKQRLIETR